jgi:hypothetical protein
MLKTQKLEQDRLVLSNARAFLIHSDAAQKGEIFAQRRRGAGLH